MKIIENILIVALYFIAVALFCYLVFGAPW